MHNAKIRTSSSAALLGLAALTLAAARPAAAQLNYLGAHTGTSYSEYRDQTLYSQGPAASASVSATYTRPTVGSYQVADTAYFGEVQSSVGISRATDTSSIGATSSGVWQDYVTVTSSDPSTASALFTFTLVSDDHFPYVPPNTGSWGTVNGSVNIYENNAQYPLASVFYKRDDYGNVSFSGPLSLQLPVGDHLSLYGRGGLILALEYNNQPLSANATSDFRFFADPVTPGASLTPTNSSQYGYGSGHDYSSLASAPEPSQTAALGLGVLGLAGLALRARRTRTQD